MENGLELVPEHWRIDFVAAREVPGQGLCVVQRFLMTAGLLTHVSNLVDSYCYDYERRYCFPVGPDALKSLFTWDGVGDPPGEWIKEKVSGRQRVPQGAWDAERIAARRRKEAL